MPTTLLPYIPETVTVHLGRPSDASAQNVTVSFTAYIKNVASCEIYPTWPENALRANILAQISFTLNRIYTEYYRSRGYNFDITNSTAFDQSFVFGRDIFENISQLVDELFNRYIAREGFIEPLFAQYCDGDRVTCGGLSQWGTVTLAQRGYTPYQILTYYYGDNIRLVTTDNVRGVTASRPSVPLQRGSAGPDVELIQRRLNRIATNYPAIPKIFPVNGAFGADTERAVRAFQTIFNLTSDGIVGSATWYKIQYIFSSVKRLNELWSEGLTYADVSTTYPSALRRGDEGQYVFILQYYLNYVATYIATVPSLVVDGEFGPSTENAVRAFQSTYGLTEDGIVGPLTWNKLYNVYLGLVADIPYDTNTGLALPFPGTNLQNGSRGGAVRELQRYLNYIGREYPSIPRLTVDGEYGPATQRAVDAFLTVLGLPATRGVVNAAVWDAIASTYDELFLANQASPGQYSGRTVSEEEVNE